MISRTRTRHLKTSLVSIALVLLGALTVLPLRAQEDLRVISGSQSNNRWLKFTDAENALYDHLAGQAYDLLEERRKEIAAINSRQGWVERQRRVERILSEIVGPFPDKTPPLNARIVRSLEKDDYRIEHLIFESQPGFYVTASVFVPMGLQGKAPAILYCSGHSLTAYRSTAYQHAIINLVKKGFIVLAFDPVGQGERLEYYDPEQGRTVLGGSTREHSYAGAQALISGTSQAAYMIWDGIRAVDYLLTRSDVDPDRIGITGRSGGGTQSAYIAAMDDRIYAAAPECYITSFRRLLESIGPQDAEQNMFQAIARGIDHADFLEVRAPKPTLMIATTRDFFSIQGAKETAAEVERAFQAFGKPENFRMVSDDAPHASTKKNREAMYAFFQKHLDLPGSSEDLEVDLLTAEDLRVTETGQVVTSLKGETIFSLNQKYTRGLVDQLRKSRSDLAGHLRKVKDTARDLSGFHQPQQTGSPVFTGRFRREGYVVEKYYLQGEGDYIIPYLLMLPDSPSRGTAILYLHPEGKSAQAGPGEEIEWFVKRGFIVMAPDLAGMGEIGPGRMRGDADIDRISYDVWFASMLIGRSILAVRAGDVLRLIDVLQNHPQIQGEEIYGVARQEICPVLLHAAAFSPAITRIALIEPYASYRSIVMNHRYNPEFIHGAVPGALTAYDLPDLAAAIAPARLLMANITDEDGNPINEEIFSTDLRVIRSAYRSKNQSSDLIIRRWEPYETLEDLFLPWIR